MPRPRTRLNEIIDGLIGDLLAESGAAKATDIYSALVKDHDEVVKAELNQHAKAGLMRQIESRLKHYEEIVEAEDRQMQLPGIPDDLQRRMGRVITAPDESGEISYYDLHHVNTTIGHVRRHVLILEVQASALDKKIAAFVEVLRRCGPALDDTPFIQALKNASQVPADT